MITRQRQSTVHTQMPTLAQRLPDFCSADACLTRTTRIDFYQQSPSTFSLVRQHEDKSRPRSVVNTLSEVCSCQSLNIQILNSNQSVFVYQLARKLVKKVSALVANSDVRTLQQQDSLPPALRAYLSTRYPPLTEAQSVPGDTIPTWILNGNSVRQSCEITQTNVNANGVRVERQQLRLHFAGEDRKPFACLPFDRERFYLPLKRTVLSNLNASNFSDAKSITDRRLRCVLTKPQAVIATNATEARVSGFRSTLNSRKERLERFIKSRQRFLKCLSIDARNVWALSSDRRNLIELIVKAYLLALKLPSVPAFLQGRIVKLAANRKLRLQGFSLPFGRINTVTI